MIILAIFLIAVVLIGMIPSSKIKMLVVQSGSMEPDILTGSLIVIFPADNYEIGDVITFTNGAYESNSVTHRIVDITEKDAEKIFTTKGDANNGEDRVPVREKDIMGKMRLNLPYLGYLVSLAKRPMVFFILIFAALGSVIYGEATKIKEAIKIARNNNEQNIESLG